MPRKIFLSAAFVAVMTAIQVGAQQPPAAVPSSPIKCTLLQKVDVPGANFETVTGVAEIMPNVNIGGLASPAN